MMNVQDINRIESAFLADPRCHSDSQGIPNHVRWEMILIDLPEMAKRHLYQDLTDIFKRAYERGTYDQVASANNLAILRARFFATLRANNAVLPHVYRYEYEASIHWAKLLRDKFNRMSPARRKRGDKIIPEKARPFKHHWIH